MISELSQHILASGGKRIRPIITLLTSKLCNYKDENHLSLAACIEFIHTATLLHDDVIDESKLRRGVATANDLFGNKTFGLPMLKTANTYELKTIRWVGHYAVQFTWGDRHDSGIYTLKLLKALGTPDEE